MKTITLGKRSMTYGPDGEVGELREANDLLGDAAALGERLEADGYLLIRGLHPRDRVLAARQAVLEFLNDHDGAIDTEAGTLMAAHVREGRKLPRTMGNHAITHAPPVRAVLEGEPVFSFFETLFGETVRTFDYKWLRAVGPGGSSGAHYDFVYMGRGSGRLCTCWVPLGDVPVELGSLAICTGSHREEGFARLRETYGRSDVDRDRIQGWFSDDPREITGQFGGAWATTDFAAGDVVLFGMHTMHMSTRNETDRWRLSCDTRFQPAADPVDERWVGENPVGHYAWHSEPEKNVPMEAARKAWGV